MLLRSAYYVQSNKQLYEDRVFMVSPAKNALSITLMKEGYQLKKYLSKREYLTIFQLTT